MEDHRVKTFAQCPCEQTSTILVSVLTSMLVARQVALVKTGAAAHATRMEAANARKELA